MDLMDAVRRPVVHDVRLLPGGGREAMVGSLCVSAYYLLFSTRRHEGAEEITVSASLSISSRSERVCVCVGRC